MWLALRRQLACANFGKLKHDRKEAGFFLVAADSLGGMVDSHDGLQVSMRAGDARQRLDPQLAPEEAARLARIQQRFARRFVQHHPAFATVIDRRSTSVAVPFKATGPAFGCLIRSSTAATSSTACETMSCRKVDSDMVSLAA